MEAEKSRPSTEVLFDGWAKRDMVKLARVGDHLEIEAAWATYTWQPAAIYDPLTAREIAAALIAWADSRDEGSAAR